MTDEEKIQDPLDTIDEAIEAGANDKAVAIAMYDVAVSLREMSVAVVNFFGMMQGIAASIGGCVAPESEVTPVENPENKCEKHGIVGMDVCPLCAIENAVPVRDIAVPMKNIFELARKIGPLPTSAMAAGDDKPVK